MLLLGPTLGEASTTDPAPEGTPGLHSGVGGRGRQGSPPMSLLWRSWAGIALLPTHAEQQHKGPTALLVALCMLIRSTLRHAASAIPPSQQPYRCAPCRGKAPTTLHPGTGKVLPSVLDLPFKRLSSSSPFLAEHTWGDSKCTMGHLVGVGQRGILGG